MTMTDPIRDYLERTRELARFTTQNGWPDNDTLRYEVTAQDGVQVKVNVHFVEVVMEGAGCCADRVECFGQFELTLDESGRVIDSRII